MRLTDKEGNELPFPIKAGRWGKEVRIEFESGTMAMKFFHSLVNEMGYPNPAEALPPLPRRERDRIGAEETVA